MQEQEIWKPIMGYEGLYEISNYGRVKSLGNEFKRKEKILKITSSSVMLSKNGIPKTHKMKDLLIEAFGEGEIIEYKKCKKDKKDKDKNKKDKKKKFIAIDNLDGEVWKSINDNENYMISNKGRVKIVNKTKEKLCTISSGAVLIRGTRYNVNLLMLEHFGHIALLDNEEEFVDVCNYEGLYLISNRERVLNLKTGKILSNRLVSDIYVVELEKNSEKHIVSVNKLMKQTFGKPIENLEGEEWRKAIGYDYLENSNVYVSNKGRVKRVDGNYEKLIPQSNDGHGYLKINVKGGDGKRHPIKTHRLVALAFIPNDDETKNEVNHIDENKKNNCVENLEWCDRSYNVGYGTCRQRAIETRRENGTWFEKKIYCLELDRVFPSIKSACDEFGYDKSSIWSCINNYRGQQTSYGMHWYYADEYFKED